MLNVSQKITNSILFLVLAVFFLCAGTALANDGPMAQLRPTLSQLTSVLSDPSLKGDAMKGERRAKIMDSIKVGFDFREMSRRILGSTWNSISEAERKEFTAQMTKLLENAYIGKLESYSGQTIGYVSERVKGNRAQVSTLIEDEDLKIPVHYIMSRSGSKWMVYDINIEGVSLVRNYNQQFRSILRTQEFDGLMEVLKEKNSSFDYGTGKS